MIDPRKIAVFITEDPDIFLENDEEILQKLRKMLSPMTGPSYEANLAMPTEFPGGEKKLRDLLAVYADNLIERGVGEGEFIAKALQDKASEQEILNVAKNSADPIAQKIALSIAKEFDAANRAFVKNPNASSAELAALVEEGYDLFVVSMALENPNMPAGSIEDWWRWVRVYISNGSIVIPPRHGASVEKVQTIMMSISKSVATPPNVLADMWAAITDGGVSDFYDFIDILYNMHENNSTPEDIKRAINPDGFDLKTEMGEWLDGYGARGR